MSPDLPNKKPGFYGGNPLGNKDLRSRGGGEAAQKEVEVPQCGVQKPGLRCLKVRSPAGTHKKTKLLPMREWGGWGKPARLAFLEGEGTQPSALVFGPKGQLKEEEE